MATVNVGDNLGCVLVVLIISATIIALNLI